jgi:hypothetical protein
MTRWILVDEATRIQGSWPTRELALAWLRSEGPRGWVEALDGSIRLRDGVGADRERGRRIVEVQS